MKVLENKPLLLLDIDGVTNAFRFKAVPGTDQPKYKRKLINGYRIVYRPEWVEWVDGMVAVTDAIWATMWQEDALFHFAPKTKIGTTIERYIDFHAHYEEASEQRTGRGVGDYKHPGILVTVGDRPFVWIDDDISERQWEWALERTASGIPTLLIQPDPAVGLEWDHVAQVHKFHRQLLRSMKIDNMGNEYCEFCGQDIKLSPANKRSDIIEKVCLVLAIFLFGMFLGDAVKKLMLKEQGQIAMFVGALLVAASVGALNGFWFGVMFFGFAAIGWGIIAVITEYADR